MVAAQRDEVARLKGLKGCPSIKPSGMEKNTKPLRGGKGGEQRRRGKVTPRVRVETEVLRAVHPPGSHFKGYEPYGVQDLVISARAVHDRRERWLTPDGDMVVAPLLHKYVNGAVPPAGVSTMLPLGAAQLVELVATASSTMAGGAVMGRLRVAVQPAASVTVTLKVPAASPVRSLVVAPLLQA